MPLVKLSENPEIYNIKIPLPKNALRDLNVYVIVSEGEALVIDTGFRMEECREGLLAGLEELGIPWEKITLFITHMHSDHAGQIDLFTSKGCPAYMGESDLRRLKFVLSGKSRDLITERYLQHGFPEDELNEANKRNPIYAYAPTSADDIMIAEDGKMLEIGKEKITCMLTPGHTPGHMCLYMEEYGILFAGDHVLYDITPNITMWTGVTDSLGLYLDSLEKTLKLVFKVVYPAHRELHDHAFERIEEIIGHHEERLNEALDIVRSHPGYSAYEVAREMRWSIHGKDWSDYPVNQKWFAIGEALAHLEWLMLRGYVEFRDEGEYIYMYPTTRTEMVGLLYTLEVQSTGIVE